MTGEPEGQPPLFGSWRGAYVLVLGVLVVEVVLLSWLSWSYR